MNDCLDDKKKLPDRQEKDCTARIQRLLCSIL